MKDWLTRAAAGSVQRGRRAVTLGWARWFPPSSTVEPSQFQGPDEPYPDHWRRPPAPWSADVATPVSIAAALETLPDLWRAVVWARDAEHRGAEQVAGELGLTLEQEQQILSQARAALREQLAQHSDDGGRR